VPISANRGAFLADMGNQGFMCAGGRVYGDGVARIRLVNSTGRVLGVDRVALVIGPPFECHARSGPSAVVCLGRFRISNLIAPLVYPSARVRRS
jgi:hypothetical protein